MMEFFVWTAHLAENQRYLYAVVNILSMCAMGVALALVADVIIKALGINLGSYKKEYEDEIGGGLH